MNEYKKRKGTDHGAAKDAGEYPFHIALQSGVVSSYSPMISIRVAGSPIMRACVAIRLNTCLLHSY